VEADLMHILRKGGIYHYNRRIPDLLKSYIGSDCVRFSLKVKNHQQAMILSRKIDSEVDILIFRVKTEIIDPDKVQEKLIQIGLIRPSESRIFPGCFQNIRKNGLIQVDGYPKLL
jgi:hypothetical protein